MLYVRGHPTTPFQIWNSWLKFITLGYEFYATSGHSEVVFFISVIPDNSMADVQTSEVGPTLASIS
jgi:hypothetical protein